MRFYGAEYNTIELGFASFNSVVLCSIKPHIDLVQVQYLYNIVVIYAYFVKIYAFILYSNLLVIYA
jgi:hypothetical protein